MMGRQDRSSPGSRHVGDDRVVRLRANNRTPSIIRWLAVIPGTRCGTSLSAQHVQHFSSGGKIHDFVLGVECVDDDAQARRAHLGAPLTREN
jgi:hypothetical protein